MEQIIDKSQHPASNLAEKKIANKANLS